MKRKLLLIIVSIVVIMSLAFSLVACNKDSGEPKSNNEILEENPVIYQDNIITKTALMNDGIKIPSESSDQSNPYKKGNYNAYANVMKTYIEANPDNNYYFGYGIYIKSTDTPTAKILDDICGTTKPVVIVSENWHECWLNTPAIKEYIGNFEGNDEEQKAVQAWINKVGKDCFPNLRTPSAIGLLVGYFKETASFSVIEQIPHTVERIKGAILEIQNSAKSNGFNTIDTPIAESNANKQITALKELDAAGKLELRFRLSYEIMEFSSKETRDAELQSTIALSKETTNNNYIKISGIKVYLDGIDETLSFYTLKAYPPEAGKADGYKGIQRWYNNLDEELKELVYETNKAGLAVKFHAVGDAAVRQALDACEYAVEQLEVETPNFKNSIVGCSSIDETGKDENGFTQGLTDAERFEKLGVTAVEL